MIMNTTPQWSREEKRHGERRKGDDRREMIRFEPDKEDRRSGLDRRGGSVKDKWGTDKPI